MGGGSTCTSRLSNDGSAWTEPRSLSRRTRIAAGAGCDVEVAGVTVGTVQAWTSRSRRSARRRPDGTLYSRRGRPWWPAPRAPSRSATAPVKRWATPNGSGESKKSGGSGAVKHHGHRWCCSAARRHTFRRPMAASFRSTSPREMVARLLNSASPHTAPRLLRDVMPRSGGQGLSRRPSVPRPTPRSRRPGRLASAS